MAQGSQTTHLDQARYLYETVQLLQRRVLRRHTPNCAARGDSAFCVDLTLPQLHMMMAVRNHGRSSLKDLAEALQVSPPSASTMVDRLVEMGMLTREPNPSDRREVVVGLSAAGREVAGRMEDEILRAICELLEKIGPRYAALWCEVYGRLRMVLAEEDGGPDAALPPSMTVEPMP
jgi:DNA-binding MarR family transcriptional regulator